MIWSWATCARRRAVEVRDAWAVWMRDAWTWLPIRLVWQRRMGWLTLLLVRFRGQSGSRHRRLQECPILQNRTLVEGDG